jgi:hypothetical protein
MRFVCSLNTVFDSGFWGDFGNSADHYNQINGQVLEGTDEK